MTMDRAYSLLQIKSVDTERRILTGIATTPSPDRMGDEVLSKGAEFKLPIPFLWQHDSDQPVGEVTKAKVTNAGIEVEVQLASIDEPGTLKDRLDEAWQSIKIGLVKGLSIGFSALEYAFTETGIKFSKWLWLELSAVTIPANGDCSIQTVKSVDRRVMRAASGAQHDRQTVRLIPTPGVSGTGKSTTTETTKGTPEMKTITEQIAALEATRVAKAARMGDIMGKAAEEGRTTDQAEAEEVDTLTTEVKSIDADLVRLNSVAALQRTTPVAGQSSADAGQARGGFATVRTPTKAEPGINFARWAMCLAKAHGNVELASMLAKQHYGQIDEVNLAFKGMREMGLNTFFKSAVELNTKAAVGAATTSDATNAGPLVAYNQFAGDFVDFLRPQSIIGKFGTNGIPALRRIPFNVHIRGQTSGGQGYWVGQGKAKPLTKFDFNDVYLGWTKLANIAVMTEELMRFSDPAAETLVRQSLADAIVQRMDIDFIDPANAGIVGVKPRSITNGVTPVVSAGATAANIRTDIDALWNTPALQNYDANSAVYIMDAKTARRLSLQQTTLGTPQFPGMTMRGGTLDGIPVIVSNNLAAVTAGSYLILVYASEIFLADDGQVTIAASTEASLEMSDAPTGDAATPTAGSVAVVSMFQTDSVALRAERYINWAKRRANAVQIVSGVNYAA